MRLAFLFRSLLHRSLLLGAVCASAAVQADNPDALAAWRNWIEAGQPERHCPVAADNAQTKLCHFPSRWQLTLEDSGAHFLQQGERYSDGLVNLGGDSEHWPLTVSLNGSPAVVVNDGGRPAVSVAAGRYRLEGRWQWSAPPIQLALPPQTGLVALWRDGARVEPRIEGGQLLLGAAPRSEVDDPAGDLVNYRVYRLLADDVPQRLTTVLEIDAAGRDRAVTTGRALPSGFAPIAIDSQLPTVLNDNGTLTVQLRPGRWQLRLEARAMSDSHQLHASPATADWPAEELWSVQENLSLRQLQLGGANQIDPQQTELPPEWRQLPTFLLSGDQSLHLTVLQQGRAPQAEPAQALSLERTVWLDFDGSGFTSRESISGQFHETARLNAAADYQLGSARVGDRQQVITHLPDAPQTRGISVRPGQQQLTTTGRSDQRQQFSASGWQHSFSQASLELMLPPGWRLLHASGVDQVRNSWLSQWDLWAIFLVVVTVAASAQLLGTKGALLAATAFTLGYHSQPALAYLSLSVLVLLALTGALPANSFRRLLAGISALVTLVLVLVCLSFFVTQLRIAMYPQLAEVSGHRYVSDPMAGNVMAGGAAVSAEIAVASDAEQAVPAPAVSGKAERLYRSAAPAKRVASSASLDNSLERLGNAQTGPGLPDWHWVSVQLNWSGPITADQQVRLFVLSPLLNRGWHFASALLMAGFLICLLTRCKTLWSPIGGARPALASLAALLATAALSTLPSAPALADYPSQELLQALEQRLQAEQQQRCQQNCVSIEQGSVRVQDEQLQISLTVHAARAAAMPLPAASGQWLPADVLLNGQPANALRGEADGSLWLALPEGRHQLVLHGPLQHSTVNLPFALNSPNITLALAEPWQAHGLRDGHLRGSELQLRRTEQQSVTDNPVASQQRLPVFATVTRSLQLGSEWILTTTVTRVAPEQGSIRLALPLWPGESVLSRDILVQEGQALAILNPEQHSLQWQSRLSQRDQLTLQAPADPLYSERWQLGSEPIWHVSYQGINPLNQRSELLEWQPLAGESVQLTIASPVASPGTTHTVDAISLRYRPGARAAETTLTLTVRASEGGLLPLTLPANAELLGVNINGNPQQLAAREHIVNLPLQPGSQQFGLQLRQSQPLTTLLRTPVPALPLELSNINLYLEPPADRWLLAVGGPALGPAVLYWGVLIVVLALAGALGRSALVPYGALTWLLLGLGMSTVNSVGSLWVVAWFAAMQWRGRQQLLDWSPGRAQLLQLGLALLTIIAAYQLLSTIPLSLLSSPDMMISGNHSSAYELNWYQDRAATLPDAWLLALPLWVYRALMLAWSLWLALHLIKFARFGWQAYSRGGLWRATPKKTKVAVPAKTPTASGTDESRPT